MKLKRILAFLLAVTAVFFAMPKPALAEEVRVTVSANPAQLSEGAEVTLTFNISNYSDYELNDIRISSNGVEYILSMENQTVPPGGSAENIQIVVPVSDAQIGLDMLYTVSWSQGGERRSQDVVVNIPRAAEPVITMTRTADKTQAKEGDLIRLEYKLTNETVFDMTDITLIDSDISDQPIQAGISLRRGDTSTLSYSYTMSNQNVLSAPMVTYTVNGKTKTFSAIEPLPIELMVVKLSLAVSMGAPTAAGVQFSLEISNSGNQEIRDITILDDKKNFVNAEPFRLAPGESATYPHKVVPDMAEPVRQVAFTVSGTDAQDQSYTLEPIRTYEVYPYVDESEIRTGITAETLEEWSSDTGAITVRLTISNTGTVALTNVQIMETTLGIIDILEKLENGQTQLEYKLNLGSPRNLAFTMKGLDPTGATRELGSCQLSVAYTESTQAPEATPVPLSGTSGLFSGITNAISRILIILGVMMAVAFCFLLVLTVMERNSRRRYQYYGNPAQDREDDGEEDDELLPDEAFSNGQTWQDGGRANGAAAKRGAREDFSQTQRYARQPEENQPPRAFVRGNAARQPGVRQVEAIYDRPVEVEYDDEGPAEPIAAPAPAAPAKLSRQAYAIPGLRIKYAHPEPAPQPRMKKTVTYIRGGADDNA